MIKRINILLLLMGIAFPLWSAWESGDVLWQEDFTTAAALKKYPVIGKSPEWLKNGGPQGGPAIRFSVGKKGESSRIKIPLEPSLVKGIVSLEAQVKGLDLRLGTKRWFGPKLAFSYTYQGKKYYPGTSISLGTSEWNQVKAYIHLPDQVSELYLYTGIEQAYGELHVAEIKIRRVTEISDAAMREKYRNHVNKEAAQIKRGPGSGTVYRGFMLEDDFSPEAFEKLHRWGANLVRYPIVPRGEFINRIDTPERYLAMIDAEMPRIDQVLKLARQNGIKVVIDVHCGPAMTRSVESSNVLNSTAGLSTLEETWRRLARRYRGNPAVYGYDLLNEPVAANYVKGQDAPWEKMVKRLVKVIREIDSDTPIIVEWYLNTEFFLVNDQNVIYSPHFYQPKKYTHQGLHGNRAALTYPGEIDGIYWDKEQLRVALKACIQFQLRHHVKIYIGEFSAPAWAEGRARYLSDCIELFEEYGWDWTYHSFRGFWGWSLEYGAAGFKKKVPAADTPAKQVILEFLLRNRTASGMTRTPKK